MIVKKGNKYEVVSHTTGRSFGTYTSRKKALRRLREMQFFKTKNAQAGIYLSIVIALMLFIMGMLMINFLKDRVTDTRNNLECSTNTTISDGTKLACLITDSVIPYIMLVLLSGAGGILLARFLI